MDDRRRDRRRLPALRLLRLTLACAVVASMPLIAAPVLADDARDAYRNAVEALQAGRDADAERLLRAAIAERPEEKDRMSLFQSMPYLPHYYLGKALAAQGDCQGALAAWRASASQGAIAETGLAGDLASSREACERSIQQIQAARDAAESAMERAERASRTLRELEARPALAEPWNAGSPSPAAQGQAARDRLASARSAIDAAGASADALESASAQAEDAAVRMERLINQARGMIGEINAATAESLDRLEQSEASARRALRSAAPLEPYPRQVGRRVEAVRSLLDEVETQRGSTDAEALDELNGRLVAAARLLRGEAAGPPDLLDDAAAAYLAGEYLEVVSTLGPALAPVLEGAQATEGQRALRADRARFHAYLLRAAALYQLHLLRGEDAGTTLDGAVADIEAAASLGDALGAPSEAMHSPRFIELYETTVAAARSATDTAEVD
ncbi:MAG: hypothetical protein AAGN46_04105 [Acidobacteriota bacterium]